MQRMFNTGSYCQLIESPKVTIFPDFLSRNVASSLSIRRFPTLTGLADAYANLPLFAKTNFYRYARSLLRLDKRF